MEKNKQKVALYARVSLDESSEDRRFQDPENQVKPLKEYAERMGWECEEFIEKASGGGNRVIFQNMLSRCMMRQFDGILVWSIDRFSREGIVNTLSYIRRLKTRGVWVKSLKEEWLDSSSMFSELMLAQMAWFAEYEKKRISDRTKAALARKKAAGVKLGRPETCLKCGWSHKSTKQCKTPIKEEALRRALTKKGVF